MTTVEKELIFIYSVNNNWRYKACNNKWQQTHEYFETNCTTKNIISTLHSTVYVQVILRKCYLRI